jgi:hypothetical protein
LVIYLRPTFEEIISDQSGELHHLDIYLCDCQLLERQLPWAHRFLNVVKCLLAVQSPLLAEAEACRAGLRLLATTVDAKVILETDSKILVDLWNSQIFDPSEVATILTDI